MEITKLFDGIEYKWLTHKKVSSVSKVTHKCAEIRQGDCYISLSATQKNNVALLEAYANGATLIVVDKYIIVPKDVAVIKVKDIRECYALLAKNYYGKVSDKMQIVGVVGTNGKSTTAYLTANILQKNGVMCGLIGTGFYMIGGMRFSTSMTTPDPMDLHCILSLMHSAGVGVVVMEVSAHAIYFKKIYGINYRVGIFTNLSQDHLDFFGNISRLEQAKHSFFFDGYADITLCNIDDESGKKLSELLSLPMITYAVDCEADFCVSDFGLNIRGSNFVLDLAEGNIKVHSNLIGKYNIYNAIAAMLACKILGVGVQQSAAAMQDIAPLDGRANIFIHNGINYVIDYAHTPIGLQNILTELKKITEERLIVVFGAGGDRDKEKRSIMGHIAEQLSDIVIITSDNPRFEDESSIISDILSGFVHKENAIIIEDRRLAVAKAIEIAKRGDTIVMAGKGAEEYFEKNGRKYEYSDKNTLEELLDTEWK